MPKFRVLKGGWYWMGELMVEGSVHRAPSAEWIQNRMADGGLVEPIAEEPAIEAAVVAPAETAALPRARARKAKG